MKDRAQIKEELERQYLHRLQLRLDRKLKNCCKNCKRGKEKEFNLGEFGIHSKFVCKDGLESGFPCSCFESLHTNESVERELLNDLKDQIRQIMLDNRLPQENGPVRSALEIAERVKTLSTDIGASYGRLIFEYVIPLFRRIIEILTKKGLLILPQGFDIDSFFVQVQVVSPIAQQQSVEDVQKFIQAYQMIAGIDPQLAQLAFMLEDVPQWLCEKLGSPASLLRDETEKEQLKEEIKAKVVEQLAALQLQNQGEMNNG